MCSEESVNNSISQGLDVLLLYLCKACYGYHCSTVCLVLTPCWLLTTAILILRTSNSFYLLEEISKAKSYFFWVIFFVTLHLLCNWQCSSVDYNNLHLSLYTCAIHTIQCGWHRGGPMGPVVHCGLTDTLKNMYSSSFSFRIAIVSNVWQLLQRESGIQRGRDRERSRLLNAGAA